MGALTPFLDDIVLALALIVAVALLAPGLWPYAVLGIVVFTGFKVWLLRAHFRRPAIGVEAMVGRVATALEDLRPRGQVDLDGEIWEGEGEGVVRKGEKVQVAAVEGLRLRVVPLGVIGPVRQPTPRSVLLGLAEKLRRP